MKANKSYILTMLLFAAVVQAAAQQKNAADTSLKGATIEIIQSYKPEVKQTPKPELPVELPPANNRLPRFEYDVPQQNLNYTYNSPPLKPLALSKTSTALPFENYLKAGGGNLSTFYVDCGVGSLHGENYNTSLLLHHISQAGDIKNQQTALNGLTAEGSYRTTNNIWHAGIDGIRNRYSYYGYDHDSFNYISNAVTQIFTGLKVGLDMQNATSENTISYHPAIKISTYADNYGTTERSFGLDLPFAYRVDTSLQLKLGINTTLTQYSIKTLSNDNNILQATPAVQLHTGNINAIAGLYPTMGRDGTTYILPDLDVLFKVPNTQFSINIGWKGDLRQNTYEQLSTRNPYMYNAYLLKQTHTDEVYGGIQTNIGDHVTLTGRVSWWQYQNLPLFINDTASADQKQFRVIYDDKVNALAVQLGARYQLGNTFALGLSGSWTNYSNSQYRHVWHEPTAKLKADILYRPIPELVITGYLSMVDEIYALEKNNISVKLNGVLDIGGSAEYTFMPRLSAFININNILNNKYERWYGYPSYGLNIYGGIRIKF